MMRMRVGWTVGVVAVVLLGGSGDATAQPTPYNLRYNSGQEIQPIFEGWSKNADGSFDMHFGYLNRNYVEQLHVPVGPDNSIQPGGPDRGQPTFFYTRVNRRVFSVTVPSDWGDRELVWTLTVHGRTLEAIGWFQPEWEIDPVRGGRTPTAEQMKNQPPALSVDATQTVTLGSPVTLTAKVSDDGLPTPRRTEDRRPIGQETPPTLKAPPDDPEAPDNVPRIPDSRGGGGGAGRIRGLAVSWMVWRGPANVEFDPRSVEVKEGKAIVAAAFSKPGTYVLRARANDGDLSDVEDVTVTVRGASSP